MTRVVLLLAEVWISRHSKQPLDVGNLFLTVKAARSATSKQRLASHLVGSLLFASLD